MLSSFFSKFFRLKFVQKLFIRFLTWWYRRVLKFDPEVLPRPLAENLFQISVGLPFQPFHFYSALANPDKLWEKPDRWFQKGDWSTVDWNEDKQFELLEAMSRHHPSRDIPFEFRRAMEGRFGPGYGEIESYFLYTMIRFFLPARIVEIGSGVSTHISLMALKDNEVENGKWEKMICVEPFPSEEIRRLASTGEVELHVMEVQDAPFRIFEELKSGDFLFIDTSHVSKLDSDVQYLYLEVLPRLKTGVIIHIHDISFPYLCVPPTHSVFRQFANWNESALVKAFLMYNQSFEILQCQSYLHFEHREKLKKAVPTYNANKHLPASLWLRKIQ